MQLARPGLSSRRSARTAGRGDRSRADAAVARQGLSAAGGAQARNGLPEGQLVTDGSALRSSQRKRAALAKFDGQPGTARSARP